jgi:hypothetical protein
MVVTQVKVLLVGVQTQSGLQGLQSVVAFAGHVAQPDSSG